MRAIQGIVVLTVAACACSKARPLQGEPTQAVSWEEDIAPLFAAQCSTCHSGATPAGGYRTTSYLEALGPQSAPVAVAGDANSLLLRTIAPGQADATHAPVTSAYDKARAWVVDGRVSFFRSLVHPGGIMNPRDPEFHSNLVRDRSWNFAVCQDCHGTDLAGGKAGVSCQECHSFQFINADGSPTCASCHGSAQSPAPPRDLSGNMNSSAAGVGAHQAHLVGRTFISAPIACGACHQVPAQVDSPGHIENQPARVVFSGLGASAGATPSWNAGTLSCSSTYCHGGGTNLAGDTAFRVRAPVWTLGTSQAFCGSCHGIPPSTPIHSGVTFPDCARCHPNTVTASGSIIVTGTGDARTSFHINGVVDATP